MSNTVKFTKWLFICLIIFSLTKEMQTAKPDYKTKSIIDYDISFSEISNVTLVFTTCGNPQNLKEAVLSFFYYNTYPLRGMILVDRCSTSQTELRKALPSQSDSHQKWFKVISFSGTDLEAYQKAYELVKTKYIMNMVNRWITLDGMGYIEQAIDAIQYGERNGIKISQATALFPYWKTYRSLGTRMKTDSGTIFYQIRTFKPTDKYYFTLNNCLMNFQLVFSKIVEGNFENYCNKIGCRGRMTNRQCCQKALGRSLYEQNGYIQIFIDNGEATSSYFQLK